MDFGNRSYDFALRFPPTEKQKGNFGGKTLRGFILGGALYLSRRICGNDTEFYWNFSGSGIYKPQKIQILGQRHYPDYFYNNKSNTWNYFV
jgi:hypothetical protein